MDNLFQQMMDHLDEAVLIINNDGIVTYCNSKTEKLFQKEKESIVNNKITDHFEEKESVEMLLQTVRDGVENASIEVTLVRDKENYSFKLKMRALRKEGLSEATMVFAADITLETERKIAETALLESHAFVLTLINSLQKGFAVIEEGKITIANDAIHNIYGVNPNKEGLFGLTLEEVLQKVGYLYKDPETTIERLMENARNEVLILNQEKVLLDGRTLEYDFIPVEIAGKVKSHIWVVRDITFRKEIEQGLESARAEAIRANQAKSLFLSKMSHDLRTPLNSIIGFSQILLESENESPLKNHKKKAQRILTAGEHLLSLIKNMLDLSSIELESIEMEEKPVKSLSVNMESHNVFHILYIEDNQDNFELMEEILKLEGDKYYLIHAKDGQTGIHLAKNNRVDLILLDMNLPDMSGEELLTTFIENLKIDLPIIVLSANALLDQKEKAFLLGCSDYITKPFIIKDFLEMLNAYTSPLGINK